MKSVVQIPSCDSRNRSSSRERRPKKCTMCSGGDCEGHPTDGESPRDSNIVCDGEHDHEDDDEPLDYEDDVQDMSPVNCEEDISDDNDRSDEAMEHEEGDHSVSSHESDNHEPEQLNESNNADEVVSEVRASAKYVRKRKNTVIEKGKQLKRKKGGDEKEDTETAPEVQSVLSNTDILAKVMKECAPVFAKAMQEAVASTASADSHASTSPMQALDRSRAAKSGKETDSLNADMRMLRLRTTRNGAVDTSNINPTLSEATIYTQACQQMTPPDDNDLEISPVSAQTDTSLPLVIPADDNIEFNFAGRAASQPTRQVFDPEADTRRRAGTRANAVVSEAENAKSTLLKPPGELVLIGELDRGSQNQPVPALVDVIDRRVEDKFVHAFRIDQEQDSLTARVNPEIKRRIAMGEYVNLQRLLPKARVDPNDDHDKYRMVSKDGYSYFVDDKESSNKEDGLPINSIARWDQAFRVYSAIYLAANPSRVSELAEYTQNIHKYAATYPWQRVYNYDILFRQLVEKKPTRPWDVVHFNYFMGQFGENLNLTQGTRQPPQSQPVSHSPDAPVYALNKKDCCFRFNKSGKCKWGDSCNWEHKCYLCGMSNHGYNTCRFRKGRRKGAPPKNSSPK